MREREPAVPGPAADEEWIRIGELSRRVGVTVHVIRAWERRYGIPEPTRTKGGFRLYSSADEARLRAMCQLVAEGQAPARAAVVVRDDPPASSPAAPETDSSEIAPALTAALERFDEDGAQRLLDRAFATRSQDSAIRDIVLPCLRSIGDFWEEGRVTVAQEHFATALLRGRLLGLTRGWSSGTGPRALLACPPGERHDLGLLCLGLTLRNKGWRITFLGADTPLEAVSEAATALRPDLVVLAGTATHMRGLGLVLAQLQLPALALAGPGATPELARQAGAAYLEGDPVHAATLAAALP